MTDEKRIYGAREGYPRFYQASRTLQAKVGKGELDEAVLAKIQNYMDTFEANVDDLLKLHLSKAQEVSVTARGVGYEPEQFLAELSNQVMQIKAIGTMFGHKAAGQLAAILLQFLDTVQKLDTHVLDIVDAHNRAVKLVLGAGDKGVDEATGMVLAHELSAAIERYFTKAQEKKQ